jgi:micrococcal nuclease
MIVLILAVSVLFGPYTLDNVTVVDGDTIRADVWIYPGLYQHTLIRIEGIDAPELRGRNECERALAKRSREHLAHLIAGKTLQIDRVRPDKYGRMLGRVFAEEAGILWIAAADMLDAHMARPYYGSARREWC